MNRDPRAFFDRARPIIDAELDHLLPPEDAPPAEIHRAMRYSVFAGGKRLRPALCMAGYSLYHGDPAPILPMACAIEMVHTYSLIHDDLPAMDNDDFRRGLPSCHKRFGEGLAILAGDALLTLAFETAAACSNFPSDRITNAIVRLARASGSTNGMIAGQVLDLGAEGKPIESVDVEVIHRAKTGALIGAAVWIGAYLGGATESDLDRLTAYSERIGLAFQVTDDVLDETQSRQTLGKTAGKDRERQKATYPARYGLARSEDIVRRLLEESREAIAPLGERVGLLSDISEFLETRCS